MCESALIAFEILIWSASIFLSTLLALMTIGVVWAAIGPIYEKIKGIFKEQKK